MKEISNEQRYPFVSFATGVGKITSAFRSLQEKDSQGVCKREGSDVSPDEVTWYMRSSAELGAGINTSNFAINHEDRLIYAQWLFGAKENIRLQDIFQRGFSLLISVWRNLIKNIKSVGIRVLHLLF